MRGEQGVRLSEAKRGGYVKAELLEVAKGGVYELRDGLTVEGVKQAAAESEKHRPFRCRLGHDRRTIGRLWYGDGENPAETVLLMLRATDSSRLVQCARCGRVEEKRA